MTATLHVVGAGLAGLAAAIAGLRAGWRVAVHEAAPQAGGRCRSFRCPRLDRVVDNGAHLVLGANRTALAFARAIGGIEAMEAGEPAFPFLDLADGRRRTLAPYRFGAGPMESLAALGLPWVAGHETVAVRLGAAPSYRRLWEPLCLAALNTPATDASARMFARLLRTVMTGGRQALTPYSFPFGLSAAFAAPAVATLAAHGAEITFRRRLIGVGPGRRLIFDDGIVSLSAADRAVLALPPDATFAAEAIVNVHFRLDRPPPFRHLGLTGGVAQWLSARNDVVTATVSAAGRLVEAQPDALAARLWRDVAAALGDDPARVPPFRVLKERRATLSHSPATLRRRPGPDGAEWLWRAGDWLSGPWPCTIETAVASGLAATRLAVGRDDVDFA
ncbi:FAD-dependent oxidoreductase [Magnetospirillum sp. UT-4]|uniref:hydroxysqualene dehydroxylase n=1 Tax=Magnetospirillum sp. UT-4 TaxID=2681467 RepID=UPI00137D8C09|nr:FAD-dependent oxidoreductase [Magnetospirillum sp. UT-4]CAA7615959.1 conserved exported hypothetical protein [Magnetospirillum sp. UT-4]